MSLARELSARGHAVRGTTRDPARSAEIFAAGADPIVADPDRIATIVPALDHVSVVCVLLGAATGPPDMLAQLHGPRLEMLLTRLLDTTAHGIVYERPTAPDLPGAEIVRRACERSRIPYALLDPGPDDHERWLAAALAAVERLVQ
jgi:uncharacterized protein YbjT (DUF2867 family)